MPFVLSAEEWELPHGGRPRLFLHKWKLLSSDPWELESVQGFHLNLLSIPYQDQWPVVRSMPAAEEQAIQDEVEALLQKEAVSMVPASTPGGLVSSLFVVPKAGRKLRPVIDLRNLNQYVPYQHFKMEGIGSLRDLLQPGDFMTKLD